MSKKDDRKQRVIKALAHPLRVRIINALREEVSSPNELSKRFDEGLSQVSYHVKVLKDFGVIKQKRIEPRRGAVEHYYGYVEGTIPDAMLDFAS